MSKSQEANDVFAVYRQNVGSTISGVEKAIPVYYQAVTNFQQECLQACENAAASVISVQKEFANKTGINVSVPNAVLNVIRDTNKEAVQAYSVQNQAVMTIIDAAQQNIKTFNDNAKTFTDMNKNLIQFWIQSFTLSRNN